jgi:cell division protein FtsL
MALSKKQKKTKNIQNFLKNQKNRRKIIYLKLSAYLSFILSIISKKQKKLPNFTKIVSKNYQIWEKWGKTY